MLNQLRAEWKKVTGNGMAAGFTVWVFPVGIFAFVGVMSLIAVFAEEMAYFYVPWTQGTMVITRMLVDFPTNIFPRLFYVAFAGVFFVGEYEWHTWKNILPKRRRGALLLTKFVIYTAAITLSVILSSVFNGPGMLIPAAL